MKWLMLIILCVSGSAWAGEARPLTDDPVAEARLKHLAVELRCLVCQNQTLADSSAPREVREMIAKNMSDPEIIEFLVSRYGDFVLYRPPLKATTTLLWLGPFVLMAIGVTALVMTLRRRSRTVVEVSVTDEEHRRVEQLLAEGEKRS
jgi:cytochrome c-type biogenesis protein CcmH